VTYNKIIEE